MIVIVVFVVFFIIYRIMAHFPDNTIDESNNGEDVMTYNDDHDPDEVAYSTQKIQGATKARLLGRSCESLLGICTGMMADRKINDDEIRFLNLWLDEHSYLALTWPGEIIYYRVKEILADGRITEEERVYLENTLKDCIGGTIEDTGAVDGLTTKLPVNEITSLEFSGFTFCFTGNFIYGTRSACERAVVKRGGILANVTMQLDYLIIGTMTTRSWAHTSFGNKIEKAVKYQKSGIPLLIVSESQWVKFL